MVGLVVGKPIGIVAATWLVTRFTRAKIDAGLAWIDVAGLAVLGGIGFTVSLLIGELAFGIGTERDDRARLAVLTGSLIAGVVAGIILRLRDRRYRRIYDAENRDSDRNETRD
jgi:NhaA family Na+:H+ antiporter